MIHFGPLSFPQFIRMGTHPTFPFSSPYWFGSSSRVIKEIVPSLLLIICRFESFFFLLISAFSTYENNALMHESKPRPPKKIMRGLAGSYGFAVAGSVPRRRAGIDWMSSLMKKKLGRATSWRKIKDLKIKFVVSLFFSEYTWRRGNVPSGR